MKKKLFNKLALIVVVTLTVLIFTGTTFAQGRSDIAFQRVKQVQENNTQRLLNMANVEATAIGINENNEYIIHIFTSAPGVASLPRNIDGIPVQVEETGPFYALGAKPSAKPSKTPPGLNKVPPSAPSSLVATATGPYQINLSWTDNSDNETGFIIESWGSYGGYIQIDVGANVTSYSDTGLTPATTYSYRVYAYNKYGESEATGIVNATTDPLSVTTPNAPSNLAATTISSTEIVLTWTDNSNDELGFRAEISLNGTDWSYLGSVGENAESGIVTGLSPDTQYYFRIYAFNNSGNSAYSNTADATTDALSGDDPRAKFDYPIPIGVSTGHFAITAGTIGCRVIDSAGNIYALSNNHVFANCNDAGFDDPILQPGPYDGGTIANDTIGGLATYVPIDFSLRAKNTVDAAIALIYDDPDYEGDELSNTTLTGCTPSSVTKNATVNLNVKKYGRTTRETHGTVYMLNWRGRINYGLGGIAYFTGQIYITGEGFSDGGDSGSLIVTDDGNNDPVALLFAGNSSGTIACPIDDVLTQLSLVLTNGQYSNELTIE